jgi:hypothetical protein
MDAPERIAQPVETGRFDPRLIRERAIEVRKLARLAAFGAAGIDALDRVAQLPLGGFVHRLEGVPGGAIGRDRRRREPLAVGE